MKDNSDPHILLLQCCQSCCLVFPAFLCGIGGVIFPKALFRENFFPVPWILLSMPIMFLNAILVGYIFSKLMIKHSSRQGDRPPVWQKIAARFLAILPIVVWAAGVVIGVYYFYDGEWHLMPQQH